MDLSQYIELIGKNIFSIPQNHYYCDEKFRYHNIKTIIHVQLHYH
jgi:hypothetical protein